MPERSPALPSPNGLAPPARRGASAALSALRRGWPLGILVIAAGAFAAPLLALASGTSHARACVATYEAPRGPELPDCRREIRWFVTPSRIPWTATPARYRAEELNMRAATAAYLDAAVGLPDPAALARSADGVVAAGKVIEAGSQRVVLEELGRAVGAPDLGRSAMLLGDGRTLVDRMDRWDDWAVRLRTLEAALLSGDVPEAMAIAARYADFDPRDQDLRGAIAGMLCLRGDAKRGVELLEAIQAERAEHRHEGWARNWGDTRMLMVACADKGGFAPPPLPEHVDAGTGDLTEARAALRLRLLAKAGAGDAPALRDAAFNVIHLLEEGPLPEGARVRVLAALFSSGRAIDPNLAAELALPHGGEGEPPLLAAEPDVTALDWLDELRAMRPAVPAATLRDGARALRRMAAGEAVSRVESLTLSMAAAAMSLDAARSFARAGMAEAAIERIEEVGDPALPGAARAIARSTAWRLGDDPKRALAELAREPDPGDPQGVALHLQRAEILASLGRRGEAFAEAERADEAVAAAPEHPLLARVRWTRAALERPAADAPSPSRAWPWTVGSGTPFAWTALPAEGTSLARALAFWREARRASPEDRRAIRYAAVNEHRGDAPRARVAYLVLAGQLLAPGEGDVETWLDAFAATDSRRLTLRAYAWLRGEAARWRGDAASAARWTERRRALMELAKDPADGEIVMAMGI